MFSRTCWALLVLALSACAVPGGMDEAVEVEVEERLEALSEPITFPLHTHGRYVVDARNRRVKLKSVNWYGPHVEKQVAEGLHRQPLGHIVGLIKQWGFNSVRLPFSNLMLHDTRPVPAEHLAANPQLIGLTPIEVFDRTVKALTDADILVILNNHTTFSEWCCGFDYNGLWYHDGSAFAYNQSEQMWQDDWLSLIARYRDNPRVIGADLRNEVRTMRWHDTHLPESPNWGLGDKNDWQRAARTLGDRITREHPNLLVIVEGINWWGAIPILGSGERPHLRPVSGLPLHLRLDDKLVYAAHNYGFIGPRHNGDDATSGGNIKYPDMDEPTFYATLDDEWGYVAREGQHYSAPVWVSEFGAARTEGDAKQREWFRRLVDYLIRNDLDFAYWPLNDEGFGLVASDWSRILDDDWRYAHLSRLLKHDGKQGEIRGERFTSLNIQHGDDNQSTLDEDWLWGAHKGTCPAGFRMLGLSQDQRALCGELQQTLGDSLGERSVQAVYESGRSHAFADWASGLTKYECPADHYAAGLTKHWWGTSGLLCLRANRRLGTTCQTRWFDGGDNRGSTRGGDFAIGSYKGQCGEDEYLAGFAQRDGSARALLCCSIDAIASFTHLDIRNGDHNRSTFTDDWLPGASKGTCPDGTRVLGVSQDHRAVCGDFGVDPIDTGFGDRSVQAVWESGRAHGDGDWASGRTKYECPRDYYAAGYTKHWWGTSGLLCLRARRALGTSCRTLWFDRGDNRASGRGDDFAHGSYKGQCGDGEYLAGLAQQNGSAHALLCCGL